MNGNRNIIVPPDIVPVRRVSPLPIRKRTLCRPRPEGEPVARAGGREWFGGRVFADARTQDLQTAWRGSIAVHAACLIGLFSMLAGQSVPVPPAQTNPPPLRMPAFVAVTGGGGAGAAQQLPRGPANRPLAAPTTTRAAKAVPSKRTPTVAGKPEPAPLEASPVIQASDSVYNAQPPHVEEAAIAADSTQGANIVANGGGGDEQGAGAGGPGIAGAGGGSGTGMSAGPYRLGNGIEPPRRIKNVPPIYPPEAMASRVRGAVLVEAIVGTDGRVHDARVVRSIPLLDQAALDAVRQWEFEPSKLNGAPIAVIVTVLVQFSLY